MARMPHMDALLDSIEEVSLPIVQGEVTAVSEGLIDGMLQGGLVGGNVRILCPKGRIAAAEIVSVDGNLIKTAPLSHSEGVVTGAMIETAPLPHHIRCGAGLLGRVIDPLGEPMDGGGPMTDVHWFPLNRPAPNPLFRPAVTTQMETGVRVIDGCLGMGIGQRMGLFAGPGLGKSTLLGMMARHSAGDVNVVCLVGERGREVGTFLRDVLGEEGLKKSVVVVSTADAPPMARVRALTAATAIAEWFRERSQNVLLLVDSLTRVVRARRDVAFALGERADRGGFPSAAFSALPGLLERVGTSEKGTITAIYAVLTEGKGDDPVAEEARSLLDGHIVLSEKMASAGIWPAVDIVRSVSRVFDEVAPKPIVTAAGLLKRVRHAFEENEDLILMGAYRRGASKDTDYALDHRMRIEAFLTQHKEETSTLHQTYNALMDLVDVK